MQPSSELCVLDDSILRSTILLEKGCQYLHDEHLGLADLLVQVIISSNSIKDSHDLHNLHCNGWISLTQFAM